MTRIVTVCLVAAVALLATVSARLLSPAPVLAADAIVGIETPLHESPDAGSPLLALLAEGTAVIIEGPPVDEFYPVSTASMSGWLIGETLLVQKEVPAEGDIPVDEAAAPTGDETIPLEQMTSESLPPATAAATTAPTTDRSLSAPAPPSSSEPAAPGTDVDDPLVAATGADATSTAGAAGTVQVPADATPSAPAAAGASSAGGATTDAAPPAAATPVPDAATASSMPETALAPTPVAESGPWGPASTLVNMPIRTGPGPEHALIFSVPQGSAVELTGQTADGFVSVRYKEVVGWAAGEHLGPPIEVVPETLSEGVGGPVDTKTPRPGSGVAYTTVDLSLRNGPTANAEPIAAIPAGSRVVLTGVMEYDFQRVSYRDQIGWVANQYLANPPNPEPSEEPRAEYRAYSEQQIVKIIYAAADQYGQSRQDMLRVARCESNLDPYAVNPSGSYGLFQFIRSTWKSTPYGSADIFDPKANAGAAAWMWSEGRKSEWVCQ